MRIGLGSNDGRRRLAGAAAGATLVGLVALGYAYAVEPRRLAVVRFRLGVPDLPAPLTGLRVAHLTDFHAGMAGTHRPTLRRAVAVARAWRPDLVALTGDFVDAGRWVPDANLFHELTRGAPTFAVLGNHDLLASPAATERVVAHLRAQGVEVLRNEHRLVPVRGGTDEVAVVAVDDPSTDRDDLGAALAGLPPERDPERPTILLGHSPEIVDRAPPGRFALTLAGHTHGGQLRLSPFSRRTPLDLSMVVGGLDAPYARGSHVVKGNPLFVNNGLGVSRVPFRFLAPPQVAFFTLERGVDETKSDDDPRRFLSPLETTEG